MQNKKLLGSGMLLITALIWGVAFVAQSVGMDFVGPFTFTASRSFVGSLVLLPVIFLMDKMRSKEAAKSGAESTVTPQEGDTKTLIIAGIICGIALFGGTSLQQVGISLGTTSGKAGFITALYIIGVPLLGIFLKKRVRPIIWFCVAMAVCGLYLLCVTDGIGSIQAGDILIMIGSICFSIQIMVVDHFSNRVDGVRLSCLQFLVCGIIALVFTLLREAPTWEAIVAAKTPILYTGVMSSGVAYTFQILGQKHTSPTVASLIMSLEAVFAMIAGALILSQMPSMRELVGSLIMFAAIILAQLPSKKEI